MAPAARRRQPQPRFEDHDHDRDQEDDHQEGPGQEARRRQGDQAREEAAPPATEVAPLYPGYEPYDVVQVCDEGTWADFETIRTPEDGEQARKLCDLTG